MKNTYTGKCILMWTAIGLVIGVIVSILTNKSVTPMLETSIGFCIGAILERYKNKK